MHVHLGLWAPSCSGHSDNPSSKEAITGGQQVTQGQSDGKKKTKKVGSAWGWLSGNILLHLTYGLSRYEATVPGWASLTVAWTQTQAPLVLGTWLCIPSWLSPEAWHSHQRPEAWHPGKTLTAHTSILRPLHDITGHARAALAAGDIQPLEFA